jgi:hypothetical protein
MSFMFALTQLILGFPPEADLLQYRLDELIAGSPDDEVPTVSMTRPPATIPPTISQSPAETATSESLGFESHMIMYLMIVCLVLLAIFVILPVSLMKCRWAGPSTTGEQGSDDDPDTEGNPDIADRRQGRGRGHGRSRVDSDPEAPDEF